MVREVVGECNLWTGYVNAWGHGQRGSPKHHTRLIHRIVYIDTYGPVPEDKQVNHKCGRASCINPKHLYLGTNSENGQDSASHGSQKSVKLTEEEVLEIRAEAEAGIKQKDIALMYDVTPANVSSIVLRKVWKHI